MTTTALSSIQTLLTVCVKRGGVYILSLDLDRLRDMAKMLKVTSKEGSCTSRQHSTHLVLWRLLLLDPWAFIQRVQKPWGCHTVRRLRSWMEGCLQMFSWRSTAEVLGSWNYLQAYERDTLENFDFSPISHQPRSLQRSKHHGHIM